MDSGLGVVEWPLSPYATALAAGALFAFCLTFWKYRFVKSRGTEDKDPSGRKLIADLDPDEEKKARDRAGKEKREKEAAKTRNFPVLAVGETQSRFNHEHLGLLGQFGAIPRTTRGRSSESSNALPVLRRRAGEKGRRQNWQQFNPASINFSSIYQHPFCFGSEFGLNPGFFFNAKHNLHTYFSPFRDAATPGTSEQNDSFDVSIRPEILKNKPITRSALCLALQDQLHKFLNEPYREVRLNDRAIQTADISEDVEHPSDPSLFQSDLSCETKSEVGDEQQITKSGKVPLSALSLWDSGYGEKVFDDIPDVPKEHGTDGNFNLDANCGSVSNAEPDVVSDFDLTSDDLYLRKNSDSSKESSGETVIIIVSEKQDTSDQDIELSDSTNIESDADFGTKIDEHSNENIDESVLDVVVIENERQEASDRVAELSNSTNIESDADFGTIVSECSNENIDESALDVIIIEDETYDRNLELSDSTNIESDADFGTKLGEYEYSSEINIYDSILEDEEIAFDQNITIYVDDYSDKNPDSSDISDPRPDFGTKVCDYEYSGERNTHENILENVEVVFDQDANQYVGDFSDKYPDFSDISDSRVDFGSKISETEDSSEINIHENILEDEEIAFLEDQNLSQCVGDFSDKNPDFSDISNPNSDCGTKISECEHSGEINIRENILEDEEIVFDENLNPYVVDFPDKNPDFSDPHPDSGRESLLSNSTAETENSESLRPPSEEPDLDPIQGALPTPTDGEGGDDENVSIREIKKNMSVKKKTETRAEDRSISEERSLGVGGLTSPDLERVQSDRAAAQEEEKSGEAGLSLSCCEADLSEKRRNNSGAAAAREIIGDVTGGGSSRDSPAFDEERGTFNLPRQMDRETGERSVAVESTVTTETTLRSNGDLARLSVVSRLALEDGGCWSEHHQDSVSVKTQFVEEDFSSPPKSNSDKIVVVEHARTNGNANTTTNGKKEFAIDDPPSSPRVDRLKGLLCRDEERRARAKFHQVGGGAAMEGEWDRLLRDVLASVSELERWERRRDVISDAAEDAEEQQRQHPSSSSLQSDRSSSFAMEEEEEALVSPPSSKCGETPTKVKSLRFKLDPDIFDVPSDDSFYDDDDDDDQSRRCSWRKQAKYRAFSSSPLELDDDEPVRLVSVHASVVPAGQKMVARPVGIDLRVRLTEERQTISKRAHVSTSPSQAKRRSPVSDRGWCQELSPVTENVDWRETFTPVATPENKTVPNGILKTPSPKTEPSPIESPNPFKIENGVTPVNRVNQVVNGNDKPPEKPRVNGWKPPVEKKPFLLLPRKKFEPDPEAIERITGYRSALSKPPLPPPIPSKTNANIILKSRAEQARKQYLDNKNALASNKGDGMKKFQQFLNQAQNDRARIVTSVPDLAAIERAVTEQWTKERASVSPRESPVREDVKKTEVVMPSSCSTTTTTTPDDKWASYVQSCRKHLGRRSQSMSYLETDIDIIPVLDDDDKCQSVSALDEPDEALPDPDDSDLDRSREDLDDSGRAKSEHELRIERSLRSLPVPEWYRRSEKTKTGFLLGSSNKEKRGWAAAKSLASSTSSLASCGLRRPVRSLRSSRENIPWSRSSASPDGPTLSLALAKAFREPYLGWRARTPTSSGVSSSPRASPPSWGATTTDDEANGVSFDGEDAFGRTTSSEEDRRDEPLSLDDTGADAVTVSMDTNDPVKLPGGEDTCDDINNMSMDTCELFDASVVVPVDEDPSPQADTGDDIDNLSTDTTTTEGRKLDPKLKRYSYSQSIYHSEWDEEEESRGDRKGKEEDREPSPSSPDHKVVWIESSFVGSRTTTSIVVLPEKKAPGSAQNRPASR